MFRFRISGSEGGGWGLRVYGFRVLGFTGFGFRGVWGFGCRNV